MEILLKSLMFCLHTIPSVFLGIVLVNIPGLLIILRIFFTIIMFYCIYLFL